MRAPILFGLLVAACAAPHTSSSEAPARLGSASPAASASANPKARGGNVASPVAPKAADPVRPSGRLTIPEARRYMVALINRDRAKEHLAPVELDEGPPTRAGQAHAEDMAELGYLGHWGSDGSVPEQRLTEAGGADMVLENALCFVDEARRKLDPRPAIDPSEIEKSESMFFDEVPPNDGHRKNILKPAHRKVGIGIAQPMATPTEVPIPCISQEFIDPYGTYGAVPKELKAGSVLHVEATVPQPWRASGVGLARVGAPVPIAVSELNKRRSYTVPSPYQMYWPKGFVTPIPVALDGDRLSIDVPVSDNGQSGLYELSIWAKRSGSNENAIVGLRTIRVQR